MEHSRIIRSTLIVIIAASLFSCISTSQSKDIPTNPSPNTSDKYCDHDEVQEYIFETYDVYQMYWPYVERITQASNPIGELVVNGKWYLDIFHEATNAAEEIKAPPCALEAHSHFVNGWAALGLAGFQADVGNPDLAGDEIRSAGLHFEAWNKWINDL